MTEALSPNNRSWLFRAQHQLALTVRTAGAYLGVAAFVVVFLVLSVPALRQQVTLLHEAVLVALAPEGTRQAISSMGFVSPPNVVAPQVTPVDLDPVPGRELERLPEQAELKEEPEIERTERVGLLGDIPLQQVQAAREVFGVTEAQLKALEHYIARKYRVAKAVTDRIVESAVVVGAELDINPILILAVMSVESRFNPYAESGAGAQGLMQVMTRVHTDKFEKFGDGPEDAFHPEINIRVGAQILYECIRRRGSVTDGLKCYVGATGPDDGGYSKKVLSEMRRMALAAKIKV
ncbi:MAG: transglycosylase SLT domain-containing protein [Burkholderiaceae bacterium]|nr:transglycosylase SLT domain-containing protein [Burkholderiaceae bacterium]MCD8516612.1 transglycosylase SLT domain-containing protein [Burkholderiaceae bacterium]MCD8538037.1 transglycosylase SLT domain-containing protein [Burkholderiaceae bacterium]